MSTLTATWFGDGQEIFSGPILDAPSFKTIEDANAFDRDQCATGMKQYFRPASRCELLKVVHDARLKGKEKSELMALEMCYVVEVERGCRLRRFVKKQDIQTLGEN